MIEETALIVSCDGDYADIETKPQSSCGGCASSGVCGSGVLSKVFGNKRSVFRVVNSINAKPGDQVIIGLEDSSLSRVSAVFYLVPILTMILGAIGAHELAKAMSYTTLDPFAVLGGVSGLIAGLAMVKIFARKIENNPRYQPVMLRFATSEKVSFKINPKLPA